MKKQIIIITSLIMMFSLVGCTGGPKKESYCDAKKSISVNFINETAYFFAVDFYDELNGNVIKDFNGTITMLSNSYNTTFLSFEDEDGNNYSIKTDKPLFSIPDILKIYTNARSTTFDTYKRKK